MPVDEATPLYDEHNGETFFFCSCFYRHELLASHLGDNFSEKSENTHG